MTTKLIKLIKEDYATERFYENAIIEDIKLNNKNKDYINMQGEDGKTALMWATFFKLHKTVQSLLENGANVNIQDNFGITALCIAVRNNVKISRLLLNFNANPYLKNKDGFNAVIYARRFYKNKKIIELFDEFNLNLN